MSSAVANVRQIIQIDGVDNASDAIDKARQSLGHLEKQAGKTARAAADVDVGKEIHKQTQELSGDLEGAVKGFGDFAGGSSEVVSGLADRLGACEAILRVLPGPAGIAATAIAALALGGKLLADHLRESEAKLRLLGSGQAKVLADDLDLSADAAVRLSHALEDVRDIGLRPTTALLAQVKEQAEALGQDGEEATSKFVEALAKGGDSLKEFERTYGRVRGLTRDDGKLAQSLGLSADLLGLSKAKTAEEEKQAQVNEAIARVRLAQVELARQEKAIAHERGLAAESTRTIERFTHEQAVKAHSEKAASLRDQIDSERTLLSLIEREAEATRKAALERQVIASRADLLEAKAAAALTRKEQLSLRSEAISARELAALKERNEHVRKHGENVQGELRIKRDTLETEVLRAQAAKNALQAEKESDKLAAREKGKAAAEKRKAAADKAAQEAKRQIEEIAKTEAEHLSTLETQAQRTRQIAGETASAVASAARARATSLAGSLRAQGKEEEADLVELRQAHADYATEREAINRRIEEAQRGLNRQSEDWKNLEIQRLSALTEAEVKRDETLKAIDARQAGRKGANLADAFKGLEGTAASLKGFGGQSAKVGEALSALSTGAGEVANSWGDIGKSAPAVINAVGGVASAVVDGEREKAGILALMEGAHAVAAFATGNIPGAIGHGAAALLYGGIAGGLIGTSSSGSAPSASGGAPTPSTATTPSTGNTSGGQVINIHFSRGFVVGTPQQVGKAVKGALKSLNGTGY